MKIDHATEIAAPIHLVWEVTMDLESWPAGASNKRWPLAR